MFLSFTLTLSVCLLFFLAAAILFTVAFGGRPRAAIEREPGDDGPLGKIRSGLILTAPAKEVRLAG